MRFRLRYLKHDLKLAVGTFAIGRSADCQLSLDDPLVSRRHANLVVSEDEVFGEDAGSRNGVLVNGTKITGPTALSDGDRVTIGAQDMFVAVDGDRDGNRQSWLNTPMTVGAVTVTLPVQPLAATTRPVAAAIHAEATAAIAPVDDQTIISPRRGEALRLLGGVAEKALALGNPESAERLLNNGLAEIASDVRAGRDVSAESVELAARFAARLAGGTGRGAWGDYVINLYSRRTELPPSTIVDELYVAARKMRGFDLAGLRNYLDDLRGRVATMTPTERFVLQRLDGLEKLLATR